LRDLGLILLASLAGALVVAVPGAIALRVLRSRSVLLHVVLIVVMSVLTVLAGILAVASGMFINEHDLRVLLVVVAISAAVSIGVGVMLGRRLAADAMWAAEARDRERQTRRTAGSWSRGCRTTCVPFAGMRAMAEALEDGVVVDRAMGRVPPPIRSRRMMASPDDLRASPHQRGALRLTLEAVSLGDVVSDAVASAAPVAAARGVHLVADAAGWAKVRGSEPELSRIVSNLLRNAIRHTPSDGTVTVSGGRDEDGGWLAVADGCGGIPEADLPRVFDVAFRGSADRPKSTPDEDGAGGGLGLAIVRGLVEAHHGEVSVNNADVGAFVVHLLASAASGRLRLAGSFASMPSSAWAQQSPSSAGRRCRG
jgi:signal transduction histidine kinase